MIHRKQEEGREEQELNRDFTIPLGGGCLWGEKKGKEADS